MIGMDGLVKMEGENIIFNGTKGKLVLVPGNSWIEEQGIKEDYDMYIETTKGERVPIPYLGGKPITPARFNEYLKINLETREITRS